MSASTAGRTDSVEARAWPDLADVVQSRHEAIVALWEELRAEGPTFGQQIDVDESPSGAGIYARCA